MSLSEATAIGQPDGSIPPLPAGPPYLCADLLEWAGFCFWLPPSDPRLLAIHHGQPASCPAMENLEGMIRYWQKNPEWMDMLNPDSPVYHDKQVERALYLNFWDDELGTNSRVLDLGGGVGRMTQWALSKNCSVELVDPDLRSLWRAINMASGGLGAIDVHWSTGEHLPKLQPFDAVIACEVLNYVEDPQLVIDNIYQNLLPGGTLFMSVEARWGWAMSGDVAEGSIEAFLTDGIVHIPHDRYIRTFTRESLLSLLSSFQQITLQPSHYAFSGPFELATGYLEPQKALALEARLRNHPVAGQLNRAWMAIAKK